jgi:hypothetical protein
MAGIKIVDLPALGRDLLSTDLLEMSIGGTASRKITGQEIMNASKLNVGSTPIVSGTVGRVLFQGTGNVLQQSSSLAYDDSTKAFTLTGNQNGGINYIAENSSTGTFGNTGFALKNSLGLIGALSTFSTLNGTPLLRNNVVLSSSPSASNVIIATSFDVATGGTGNIQFATGGYGGAPTKMTVFGTTGNVLIQNGGTHTDAGFKLDVNGTARVQGNFNIATGFELNFNNQNVGLYRSANNLRLGGFGGIEFLSSATTIASQAIRMTLFPTGNFAINTTTDDGFRLDVNGTARVSGTLTLNNTSGTNRSTQLSTSGSSDNLPSISFYPATGTNVGQSFDIIPKGTGYSSGIKTQFGIWGTDFIANQTNYELLLVRATGSSYTFESFKGGTGAHRPILFSAGVSNQLWAYTSGNIGINTTTDAGFRLDVNGTARVSAADAVSAFQITASTRAWYFTTSAAGGTFNAISAAANGASGSGNYGFVIGGGWSFNIGTSNSQSNSLLGVYASGANAGDVRIGGQTSVASSLLTLNSTTQGFLPPRMTNAQRTAIVSPAVGLIVYCTDVTEGLWVYKSSGWTFIV